MKTFKTICYNNIHRDYTDELIKVEPREGEPSLLWKDDRPTFKGELKLLYPDGSIGEFVKRELVVGQEYTLIIDDIKRVYVKIDDRLCMIAFGKDGNEKVIGLGDGIIDSLDYFEFFYTEADLRDNKLKQIGI